MGYLGLPGDTWGYFCVREILRSKVSGLPRQPELFLIAGSPETRRKTLKQTKNSYWEIEFWEKQQHQQRQQAHELGHHDVLLVKARAQHSYLRTLTACREQITEPQSRFLRRRNRRRPPSPRNYVCAGSVSKVETRVVQCGMARLVSCPRFILLTPAHSRPRRNMRKSNGNGRG